MVCCRFKNILTFFFLFILKVNIVLGVHWLMYGIVIPPPTKFSGFRFLGGGLTSTHHTPLYHVVKSSLVHCHFKHLDE